MRDANGTRGGKRIKDATKLAVGVVTVAFVAQRPRIIGCGQLAGFVEVNLGPSVKVI